MRSIAVRGKGLLISAGVVLLSVCAAPTGSKALGIDIFSIIDSTISRDIGGALTAMDTVQSALRQDQQTILAPVALINQSHNYVNAIMSSYRGWMSGVFALPVNSAQLPVSQSLERVFLGGSSMSLGGMDGAYMKAFGSMPVSTAAPLAHRQMMDMDDALAKDALGQSVAADQATAGLIQIANTIENENATTAPGTADMLSAMARAAEIQSLASQHKLLASMLREEAADLAHSNGIRKQTVQQAQQMNGNLLGTITPQ
jgi:hypothetical protein